jgi:nicotinamidase-related amidase
VARQSRALLSEAPSLEESVRKATEHRVRATRDGTISPEKNRPPAPGLQPFSRIEGIHGRPSTTVHGPRELRYAAASHLDGLAVDTLVFAGCNFANCPRTSIYEASERDFRIVAVVDAISGLYDLGVQELERIGVSTLHARVVVGAVTESNVNVQ